MYSRWRDLFGEPNSWIGCYSSVRSKVRQWDSGYNYCWFAQQFWKVDKMRRSFAYTLHEGCFCATIILVIKPGPFQRCYNVFQPAPWCSSVADVESALEWCDQWSHAKFDASRADQVALRLGCNVFVSYTVRMLTWSQETSKSCAIGATTFLKEGKETSEKFTKFLKEVRRFLRELKAKRVLTLSRASLYRLELQ